MSTLRILHLEDDTEAAELIHREAASEGLASIWRMVATGGEFADALEGGHFDAIVSDSRIVGLEGQHAMEMAHARDPALPFIFVSGNDDPQWAARNMRLGAYDMVSKNQLWRLGPTLRKVETDVRNRRLERLLLARGLLVDIVKQLSLARSLDAIVDIVKTGARRLNGADGATFVMREGDMCHYVAEDAIGPLWQGRKFPLQTCVSGWAMLNKQAAVIPDIYSDARVPADAYRPTFVRSLVMVPIRANAPIGAIGNYWASIHHADPDEVELIQALADSTSLAFENLDLYSGLERRVRDRTNELQLANEELEAFSYSVSHDLRAPLRAVQGYVDLLLNQTEPPLEGAALNYAERLRRSSQRMHVLIEDLLSLSKVSRAELRRRPVKLGAMAAEILNGLAQGAMGRESTRWTVDESIEEDGDPGLLRIALENLLSNAWKYTGKVEQPHIEFFAEHYANGTTAYVVRDNGAGFDMGYAGQLFRPFHRMHTEAEFPGTGIGLAIVNRVIQKHGGRIWAESTPEAGATFHFTLSPPAISA